MAKEVLKQKRKNLLNINKNGPEIFMNRNFVDLYKFFTNEEIVDFIENKSLYEIKINKMDILNKISGMLTNSQTIEELQLIADKYFFSIKIEIPDDLKGNFITYRNQIVKKLVKERGNEIDLLFKYSKSAAKEYYESSKWCLYLCYGLLEGNVSSLNNFQVSLRSPLICLPIQVHKENNATICIFKRSDTCVDNEILRIFIHDLINVVLFSNEETEELNFSTQDYFENICSKINDCGIDSEHKLILKINKTDFSKQKIGLKICKSAFIGFFMPVGGKMLEDYDNIINSDYAFPINNNMFDNISVGEQIYENDDVIEINRPLNLIQKKAVLSSMNTNTLIYGPPGTGKSEVVTNILTNYIMEKENVLIVSEKKAALDVIVDRLGKIKNITMATYDDENKQAFYDQILNLHKMIINANPISLNVDNRRYLNIVKYFDEIDSLIKTCQNKNIDINNQFLKLFNEMDINNFDEYENICNLILAKLNNDSSMLPEYIKNFKKFDEIFLELKNRYGVNNNFSFLFNLSNLEKLLEKYNAIDSDVKQYKLLKNFYDSNEIKIPFTFGNKILKDEIEWKNIFLNIIKTIYEEKIPFFIGYEKIKKLLLLPNDQIMNVFFFKEIKKNININFLHSIKSNTISIQQLVEDYWFYKTNLAISVNSLVCDHYLYLLKQKLMQSTQLQQKWIELVRKANLPKKLNFSKIIKEYYELLKIIFPVWILSPDNVASFIPLNQNEFKCGIFDEASQVRLERGIPLVYRCTNSIVSGDDKQLKPTSFFASLVETDDIPEEELDNVESLLDKAKTSNWVECTLSNHYRSVSEQLIYFSNKYIYENNLLCITKNGCFAKAIDVYNIDGIYDRSTNTNLEEAKKAIELINENYNKYEKIVVITFNQKQASLIENMAMDNLMLNDKIDKYLLKIKSLENIQGDEGDLVIISTTFAKDIEGKFIQNFGPINQSNGKNRINVMVTRAKEKMIVVKSFMAEDITNTNNENTYILKMFFAYIESLQEQSEIIDNNILHDIKNESELSKNVALALENKLDLKKVSVVKFYPVGTHMYDVAILDNNKNVVIALSIDEIMKLKDYGNNKKYWMDELDQQKYFQDRGYKILRINQIEWWLNSQSIIEKINVYILKNT